MTKQVKLDIVYNNEYKGYNVELKLTFNRDLGIHEPSVQVYENGKAVDPALGNQILAGFSTSDDYLEINKVLNEYNADPLICQ